MGWLYEPGSAPPVVPIQNPISMLVNQLVTGSGWAIDNKTLGLLNGGPIEKLTAGLYKGNRAVVQYVLKDLSAKDFMLAPPDNYRGLTGLMFAVKHGDIEMLRFLVDTASSFSASSSANDSDGSCNILEAFLRQGDEKKNTALHEAVSMGNMAAAEVLVKADPNHRHAQNSEGETPIYIAVKLGHLDILKMMCEILKVPAFDGPDGTTALHAAVTRLPKETTESSEAVQVVIDTLIRYIGDENKQEIRTLVDQADDKCGNTALHLAILGKHLGVVKQLLGADNLFKHDLKCNSDSKNPIYIAAELGYTDIFKEFSQTKYYASENAPGPRKRSVVHAAVISRDADCIRYVLEHTSDLVTSCDEDGMTPLHYVVLHKFDSVLDMIVKATVKANSIYRFRTDYEGMVPTPLWLAMEGGFTSTVIQLIKLLPGVCLEINHDNKRNILHFAAFRSDKKMVQAILKYCPQDDIDTLVKGKDDNGDTPLHLLIDQGCFIADLLKYERVVRMVKNKQDMTPLDMLYNQDKIIVDQLQIKKELDGTQVNQHSCFWRRRTKFNPIAQDSLVPSWKRSEKDDKFKRRNKELMKEELIQYKERTNTQIIVTALIVTVTFTVGFTMPGGYYESGDLNQGLVLLSKKRAFSAFMISDALALALSTISLFLYFISTTYEDPQLVSKLNGVSSGLTVVSVVAMMLTFITGTYAVLSHSPLVAITVCIICSTSFLFIIVFLIIKSRYDREKIEENAP